MKRHSLQRIFILGALYIALLTKSALASTPSDPLLAAYVHDTQLLFVDPHDGLSNLHLQKHLGNMCSDIQSILKGAKDYATSATTIATTTAYYKLFADLTPQISTGTFTDNQLITLYNLVSTVLNNIILDAALPTTTPSSITLPTASSESQPTIGLADRLGASEQLHQAVIHFVETNHSHFIPDAGLSDTCTRALLKGMLEAVMSLAKVKRWGGSILHMKKSDSFFQNISKALGSHFINETAPSNDSSLTQKWFENFSGKLLGWLFIQAYAPEAIRSHILFNETVLESFFILLVICRFFLPANNRLYPLANATGLTFEFLGEDFKNLFRGKFEKIGIALKGSHLKKGLYLLKSSLRLGAWHLPGILESFKKHLPAFMNRKTTNRTIAQLIRITLLSAHGGYFADNHEMQNPPDDNLPDNHNG